MLAFEFLTKEAARRVVAGDVPGAERVVSLVKEAFAPGTELHRELRLARSLFVTRVSSPAVAAHILTEARAASRALDQAKLDVEKTKLIERVRSEVDQAGALYEEQLPDYRTLSTIGTLLADWRSPERDIQRVAEYEDQLMSHLTLKPEPLTALEEGEERMSPGEKRAVIAVMSRKIEEKWGKELTREQRSLLREHALADDEPALLARLRSIRTQALACLERCASDADATDYFCGRLAEGKEALSRPVERADDEAVSLGLLSLKLIAEAEGS